MSDLQIWSVILGLGVATYAIRFSFLGLLGDREIPALARTLLRYVPTAVIPALVTPLVLYPPAMDGETDPARLLAAGAALAVGVATRSMLGGIATGMGALWLLQTIGLPGGL
ncbi:MAG: AzlD domain-containing protein [Pseudomonadota bacterium]